MGGKNARQKFKDRIKYIPLNPLMPQKYGIEKRATLREWEKSILKSSNGQNIGKDPGE